MSGGAGAGAPIIAAYAVVRNLIRPGRAGNEDDERAKLDAAELREVEYQSMGLPTPRANPQPHGPLSFLGRLFHR